MENRTKRLWIRLTPKEHDFLKNEAERHKIKVATYVRTCIFKKEASLINAIDFLKEYREGVRELKKIGNNVNQLAKYANFLEKSGRVNEQVILELNKLLGDFVRCQRETADLDRKILKA